MRADLGYAAAQTSNDTQIEEAVEAASRMIDGYCGRRFWQDGTVTAREYYADSPVCVEVDDISTVTGLIVKTDTDGDGTFETTLTISTDFILSPLNAADRTPVWPYEEIIVPSSSYYLPRLSNGRPGVQVTAKFGWPAVPDDVEQACRIQARELFKSKDAVFGAVALAESVGRTIPGMNRQALALLADYRKPAVG